MYQITKDDLDYANRFVGSVKAEHKYADYDELRSAAYEGLCKSQKTFDPEKYPDVKFTHYAYQAMRQLVFQVIRKTYEDLEKTANIDDIEAIADNRCTEERAMFDYSYLDESEIELLEERLSSRTSMKSLAEARGMNPDTYYTKMKAIMRKVRKL